MVVLSVWGIRQVHRAFKRLIFLLIFIFAVGKMDYFRVEWGHSSSTAAVLCHHRSATIHGGTTKQSFAGFIQFLAIQQPHDCSWRSVTRFSGSVTQTSRGDIDGQNLVMAAPKRPQTATNSCPKVGEVQRYVVLAVVGDKREESYLRRVENC